jgi:EAL and modified HD-GYP domain-containing signal transduction protein
MKNEASPHANSAKDFFLARQPILNRNQRLVAYELLFRAASAGPAGVIDDVAATATVIEHATELGLENIIGGSFAFVNIDAAVLMSGFVQFLPREKVVLEILETVVATDSVVNRIIELKEAGYRFALDDVVADSATVRKLLPYMDIIKIDIMEISQHDLTNLYALFKSENKKMLAEKVENMDQFKFCFDLGFDYFQGYYFAKPIILKGRKISPSQLVVMRLMNLIIADADNAEIEKAIKHDASLGLNLLRLMNTPAFMTTQKIESLRQALAILGRRQLQRWLQILLYASAGKADGLMSPLLMLATMRGKLLELMAQKMMPRNQSVADVAFTVGIMSLMDTLFSTPMDQILQQISVVDDVKLALLERNGTFGEMLLLVEHIERAESNASNLTSELEHLHLGKDELYSMQVQAYEWSDNISQAAA